MSDEVTLKQAVKDWLNALRIRQKYNETRIFSIWESIAGPVVKSHTQNLRIERLYVSLDNPIIRQELTYARHKLIISLNKALGPGVIKEIIIY
ncbi:MAG TPA: DUF721 domain-containing protein [Bacteroidales bacterium]|nr:DUF721 domain-containing protein [Bacteroidales bacterium]